MSLFAMIDYSLLIIFFICITALLLLGTRSSQEESTASMSLPSLRESPVAYILLATLFLLLILLTALNQRRGTQNDAFG
jgi:preprotein translocase subunit SecG